MCYAASERLAWQSLPVVRLVAVAVLRTLVDLVLLFHFFVLIVVFRWSSSGIDKVLSLLMNYRTIAASLS